MRILVLTNMYPPHAYGGYEQSCRDVVERWRARGHEVLVLTSDVRVPGVGEPPLDERRLVRRDLKLYWEDHVIRNPPYHGRLLLERANIRRLESALSEFEPAVVSAWAMGATSMGMLTRVAERAIPAVSVICDEWPVYAPIIDAWLRPQAGRPGLARIVRLLTRLPTCPPPLDTMGPACFVSDFMRRVVRERTSWRFADSGVVYSGIASGEFEFRPGTDIWQWHLLYVGRIDPRKGIETAIRAMSMLPREATLEICGTGDDHHREELRALASQLGIVERVTFTKSDRAELSERYRAADVVVFPPVWEEPFGLVPLESMACGTPVVGTRVGGAAEFLVDEFNCLAFAPGDADGLAKALTRMADDRQLRSRLADNGRQTAAEFSVDRLADVLEAWHLYASRQAGASSPGDRPLPSLPTSHG